VPKKTPDKKKKDAPTGKVETTPNVAAETTPEASAADVTITPADATTTDQPSATITGVINKLPVETEIPVGVFKLPPFPITTPSIGSLSPPGVQVGSTDTPVTILGSNFGVGSTVLWNGTALAGATIISSTQINVTIPAADLAAAGTPNVTVQNPAAAGAAPVTSNAVQFTIIPSWQQIQTQLSSVAAPLPAYVNTYVQILTMQNNTQAAQIQTDATNYNSLNTQYQTDQTTIAQQAAQITSLQSQLAGATYQTASPLDVASSFKSVVDQIQQTAQSAGGVQSTVTNMNVHVKSLLSVQGSTATAPASASLIFPSPTALPDPAHLSTLSFTFGSIPNLKTAAASAPPPSSSSSSSSNSSSAPAPSSSSSSTPAPAPATPAPGSSSSSSSSSGAAAAPSIARPQSAATSRVAVESAAAPPATATAARKAASPKKKG
jgi:hypothetical protein